MHAARCPICERRVTASPGTPPFPFCSSRCKLVDLGNWIDQRYVVRGDDDEASETEPGPSAERE